MKDIEYEATYYPINIRIIRNKLKEAGAVLTSPMLLMKRTNYNLPTPTQTSWIRVRDEGRNNITLSFKDIPDVSNNIEDQKEICLKIDDYQKACKLIEAIGCKKKAYQETKREIWILNNVEVSINVWPFLKPFIDIEGTNQKEVKKTAKLLGLSWKDAKFCNLYFLYHLEYNISIKKLKNIQHDALFNLTFKIKNPFLKLR